MLTAKQVLNEYFLDTRCMLLEIAAMLDRYDEAGKRSGLGEDNDDPRLEKIHQSLAVLADRTLTSDRSERLLELFSDPTD